MSQFIEMFGGGNWPQKTLGEVGSFTRGGGFQKSDFVEHGIPCIHYGQIHTKFGPFITSHITEISSDLESKTKFASKGDLVIAITSEDTEGACKSTAWLGDYPVAVGGHAAIYKHSMNPLYMSFFFKSTLFNYAKIEYVHGTKVFEIKPDDIAKILVPCPPMSLQNQFSAIAEQSDKSGFDGRKSQFIEMFGNPITNTKGWKTMPISEVAPEEPSKERTTGSVWLLNLDMIESNTGKIVGKVYEKDSNLLSVAPFDEGNVLYSKLRPYLNKVVIPNEKGYATTELVPLRPKQELLNLSFLSHLLRSDDFVAYANGIATGTKMPRMPLNDLRKFNCILPPIEVQREFELIAHQTDKSGSGGRESVALMGKVKKSLINYYNI